MSGEQSSMVGRSTKGRHATIASGRKVGRAGVMLAVALVMVLSATGAPPAGAAGPDFEHVHALMFDAGARGLWRSRPILPTPLFSTSARTTRARFAVDPTNARIMYVAMRDGVFRSDDAGGRWTAAPGGPKGVAAVAVHPLRPAQVYAATVEGRIFVSHDAGRTWQPVQK